MENKELAIYLGSKIKEYRTSRGWTQQELGDKLGIGKSTIANYEKGFRSPRQKLLFSIADIFDVPIDDFFPSLPQSNTPAEAPDELVQAINDKVVQLQPKRQEVVLEVATEQLDEQEKEKSATVSSGLSYISEPLFEYHVFEKLSAGTGATYWEDRNYDTVYFDEELDHDLASWVYGDSMEPKYLDGSVALIKATGFDYDGAIYAVDWDGQSYLKKVYKEKDGLRLVSLNKKYKDKFAPYAEEPRIIGKVVGNFLPMEK